MHRQAQEVALLVNNALVRLRLTKGTPDVVLGGGMLTSGEPLLLTVVIDTILATAPGARITIAKDEPVLGSALLGLDALVGPDASAASKDAREERLRATLLETSGVLQR